MAGNISISTGVETPAQSRTSVSGGFSLPARPAPAPAPAGYQLVYQMGGPRYMYGETPRYGAYYSDGGTVPGQIYGNMRGSREGADMFGFFPTMFQSQPYATASQMYTPSLGVMPLIGYPSKYPHVVMGGYTDYGAPIANQAINMMLPLLMMGLYRQMFPPMMPQAPAAAGASGGKRGSGGGSGGGSGSKSGGGTAEVSQEELKKAAQGANLNLFDIGMAGLGKGSTQPQDFDTPLWGAVNQRVTRQNLPPYMTRNADGTYTPDPSRASTAVNQNLNPKSGAAYQLALDRLARLNLRPPAQAQAQDNPVRTYADVMRANPNLEGGD